VLLRLLSSVYKCGLSVGHRFATDVCSRFLIKVLLSDMLSALLFWLVYTLCHGMTSQWLNVELCEQLAGHTVNNHLSEVLQVSCTVSFLDSSGPLLR
jgi:hypothetical protein